MAAAIAVFAAVTAVSPETASIDVLVVVESLPGGSKLAATDVTTLKVPAHLAPEGHLQSLPPGAVLAGPATARSILTEASLAGGQSLARPGFVVVPFTLPDRALVPLTTVGTTLDILGPEGPIVTGARVASVLSDAEQSGFLGGFPGDPGTILLEVRAGQASALAVAHNSPGVTVALH